MGSIPFSGRLSLRGLNMFFPCQGLMDGLLISPGLTQTVCLAGPLSHIAFLLSQDAGYSPDLEAHLPTSHPPRPPPLALMATTRPQQRPSPHSVRVVKVGVAYPHAIGVSHQVSL
ncbi:unnamed protein product [Boreogadus saida]